MFWGSTVADLNTIISAADVGLCKYCDIGNGEQLSNMSRARDRLTQYCRQVVHLTELSQREPLRFAGRSPARFGPFTQNNGISIAQLRDFSDTSKIG